MNPMISNVCMWESLDDIHCIRTTNLHTSISMKASRKYSLGVEIYTAVSK